MNSFMDSLTKTHIQFISIHANKNGFEMDLQTEFRLYECTSNIYYLARGACGASGEGGSSKANVCRVYKHADLAHLINLSNNKSCKEPIELLDISIERQQINGDVQIGNHLTFETRQSNISTYLTTYMDGYNDDYTLYCERPSGCIFKVDESLICGDRATFRDQTYCVSNPRKSLGGQYCDPRDTDMIQDLSRAAISFGFDANGLTASNASNALTALTALQNHSNNKYMHLYEFLYETLFIDVSDSSISIQIFYDDSNDFKSMICMMTRHYLITHVLRINVNRAFEAMDAMEAMRNDQCEFLDDWHVWHESCARIQKNIIG